MRAADLTVDQLIFKKRVPGAGNLVHIAEIDGVTAKGKLKVFVSHIAEIDGEPLHENLRFEEGTIPTIAELKARYRKQGFELEKEVRK